MKKISAFCLILCLVLCFYNLAVAANADELQQSASVLNGSHSIEARNPLLGSGKIVDNVGSAIVYEVSSETLMYGWNCDERVAPASLVKILTAFIYAEQGNLEDAITVKQSVLDTVSRDAITAKLQADEVLTAKDLLYCMMVGSANDAAAVLADHLYGSQAAFVVEMNRYAQTLGCRDTNFTNAHGLHDENQYTTARDVARILSAAIGNEIFRTVFEAVQYTVPETNKSDARKLITGNYLMNQNQDNVEIYYDSRVTGGRTGEDFSGRRCIAVSAQHNGMTLISVVTGSKSVYQEGGNKVQSFGGYKETSVLLDAVFGDFRATQVIHPNQTVLQCPVENGSSDVVLGAKQAITTVLPQGVTSSELDYRYTNIGTGFQAPIQKGTHLSTLEIWYKDFCIGQTDLFALNSVPVWQVEIGSDGELEQNAVWLSILKIAVGCGLGFAVLAMVLRTVSAKTNKHKSQGSKRRRRRR